MWLEIITLIIQILVFAFFITLAVFLGRIRNEKCQTAVSTNTLNWLWVGSIIFAIITFMHMLAAIAGLIWPNWGKNKTKTEYTQVEHTMSSPTREVTTVRPIGEPVTYVPNNQPFTGNPPVLETRVGY